jgi:hypothetical protein
MNRDELKHWLMELQTDAEFALKDIRNTELNYVDEESEIDHILTGTMPGWFSRIEFDVQRAKENMR